jgi:hypothetical protein
MADRPLLHTSYRTLLVTPSGTASPPIAPTRAPARHRDAGLGPPGPAPFGGDVPETLAGLGICGIPNGSAAILGVERTCRGT